MGSLSRIKRPLTRLPRDDEGHSRYFHPHGYVIVQDHRDWNLRGLTRGAQHQWAPKVWWEVYEHVALTREAAERYRPWVYLPKGRRGDSHLTLRDARAWCDEHPREGWIDA